MHSESVFHLLIFPMSQIAQVKLIFEACTVDVIYVAAVFPNSSLIAVVHRAQMWDPVEHQYLQHFVEV